MQFHKKELCIYRFLFSSIIRFVCFLFFNKMAFHVPLYKTLRPFKSSLLLESILSYKIAQLMGCQARVMFKNHCVSDKTAANKTRESTMQLNSPFS